MENNYKKNVAHTYWHKILVLGFLFLALALTSLAQNKKQSKIELGARKGAPARDKASQRSGLSSNQTQRTGDPVKRAQNAVFYTWGSNGWNEQYKYTYTYNSKGQVTQEVATSGPNNTNQIKTTYAYGPINEYPIESVTHTWQDGAWVQNYGYKSVQTFTNGRITQTVYQSYENGTWVSTEKETYAYNAAGKPVEFIYYEMEDGQWVPEEKTLIEYANGSVLPTTVTEQELVGTTWVNDERETNLVWDETSQVSTTHWMNWEVLGAEYQEYVNGSWVSTDKRATTFQNNGSYIETWYEWENNAWVASDRDVVVMDDKGNETLNQFEVWESNAWVINWGMKYTHTYNATNDITETIIQRYDADPSSATYKTYQNSERYVFSNFQTILSARKELELSHLVYPNPVQDRISVRLDNMGGGTLHVMSLTGQKMVTAQLSRTNATQEIRVDHLPAGNYILQIHADGNVRTKKIVKL